MDYVYNITKEDAKRRTEPECLVAINMLDTSSIEYNELSMDDQKVIYHLCRVAFYIDKINYKLQNAHNLDFYHFVASKTDQYSKDVLRLFLAQKSINSLDTNGDYINLAKGVEDKPGKNYYHFDLSVEKFHDTILAMLDNGEVDTVRKVLSQRTIVDYVDGKLTPTDYVDYFKEEFANCALEIDQAITYCKDSSFREYLEAQKEAFLYADNQLDAKADMLWAKLKDNKIEFTITRESYDDELTTTIFDNEKLNARLNELGIEVNPKDSLGCRVGIVNKEGTKLLDKLQNLNNIASKLMPYNDMYSSVKDNSNPDQVAVDVDLVVLSGDSGAYRAGIVLAENLPNSDKLAIKLGGGRRNVYHRQVRATKPSDLYKKLLDNDFVQYYNLEACHWATIEHENTHSLGPKDTKSLGAYASILEEFKADMGIYAFLDEYLKAGVFSDTQVKEIIVTELYSSFLKAKPVLSQAHRVRSVMITNRLLEVGAIVFKADKLSFDYDKVIKETKDMLAEVVKLQLDKSVAKARDYVNKYFVWTETHERIANIIKKNSKRLNGEVVAPIYRDATKDLVL